MKYVKNWYSVIAVYFKILPLTKARFKDGAEIILSKKNYDLFHEEFFKRYLQGNGFTYTIQGEKRTVRTPEGIVIKFSKIPYSFILNEVFVAKLYGGDNLEGRVVIDVGTYFGESPLYFASRGATKVYGFEPDMDNYKIGEENIKLNSIGDKIHIFNEPATFGAIKNLVNQYETGNIFLKLDCEGCEYDVLLDGDSQTFEKITDIVMEYHGQSEPLISKLTELGFILKHKRGMVKSGMMYFIKK
jgi:hypothetical protein